MNDFTLTEFVYGLQDLTPMEAIQEIGNAGLTNYEIAYCIKEITFNDTFKFQG